MIGVAGSVSIVVRRYLLCRGHRLPQPWTATAAERVVLALARELDAISVAPIAIENYEAALDRLFEIGHVTLESIGSVGPLLEDLSDFLVDHGMLNHNPHRSRNALTPNANADPTHTPAVARQRSDWELFPELMESFFKTREVGAKRLEGSTPANYRGDLDLALHYFRAHHKALTEETVLSYVRWLELEAVNSRGGGRYTKQTVARKKTALRSFLAYCQGKGRNQWSELDVSELLHTKKRDKVSQKPHRALAPHEDKLFIAQAQVLKIAQRLIVLIPRICGLRAEDVASLPWHSVDLANGELNYVAKKTGNQVRVPLTKELASLLTEYRLTASTETYLFPGRTRKTLDDACVREVIRKTAIKAGLSRGVTPHDLRKTFATANYYSEEATLF